MKMKLLGGLGAVTLATAIAVAFVPIVQDNIVLALSRNANGLVTCENGYQTNFDWNIADYEIQDWVTNTSKTVNAIADYSDIIESVTTVQQFRHSELNTIRFGTASVNGSLSLILNKDVDAIGFYGQAWDNSKDIGKTITVNGVETPALTNSIARYFIVLPTSSHEIVFEGYNQAPNRFEIQSIGFYSTHGFPDIPDVPVKYNLTLDANGGTGTKTIEVNDGDTYTLPDGTGFSKTGYNFVGWSYTSDGAIIAEESITITADITLYAVWEESTTPSITYVVTITPSDGTAVDGGSAGVEYPISKSNVNVTATGTLTVDQIRVFKNKSITISANGTISQIVFTCTVNGTAKYGPGCFAAQNGYTYEIAGKTGTWIGNAASVTFTASTNQVRITQIVVTYQSNN